jgi:hypothetical protein
MFKKSKLEAQLDRGLEQAIDDLTMHDSTGDEYGKILDRVVTLQKVKESERKASSVSPDTAVLALTNLIGIVMIIRHENLNVITSKALGFVKKIG